MIYSLSDAKPESGCDCCFCLQRRRQLPSFDISIVLSFESFRTAASSSSVPSPTDPLSLSLSLYTALKRSHWSNARSVCLRAAYCPLCPVCRALEHTRAFECELYSYIEYIIVWPFILATLHWLNPVSALFCSRCHRVCVRSWLINQLKWLSHYFRDGSTRDPPILYFEATP